MFDPNSELIQSFAAEFEVLNSRLRVETSERGPAFSGSIRPLELWSCCSARTVFLLSALASAVRTPTKRVKSESALTGAENESLIYNSGQGTVKFLVPSEKLADLLAVRLSTARLLAGGAIANGFRGTPASFDHTCTQMRSYLMAPNL